MAFGMKSPIAADFAEIVKFEARAGRMFRIDYNPDTREKTSVDITSPPPRFAMDFGALEVGYAHFAVTGPEYHTVPEGKPLPDQPLEKDPEGRLKFKPVFRVKIFGKILNGLREWSSSANAVLESVDDLYNKFRAAPEAHTGKIPIIELTKTIPVMMGKGARQTTVYTPCFTIVGWTDRVTEMGSRTVPPPKPRAPEQFVPQAATSDAPLSNDLDDVVPF
jgi:hypothetical protein